jgi:hypothetical protein
MSGQSLKAQPGMNMTAGITAASGLAEYGGHVGF